MEGEFRIIGTPWGLRSLDLTGELGVKAYLAWLTYERPFAQNTWHLYTGNNVRMLSDSYETEPIMVTLHDADNYQFHDLSYLSAESEWMGMPTMLLDASAATQLSILRANTYRNAQPVMVSADNALYAAFLEADQTSGNVYVAVTKFDGNSWCEPVRVDAGAVMDGAPSLCVDQNGTIWLAYSKTATDCDMTSLLDYAQKQSIVVGSLDSSTLAFTESTTYSGNGYAHLQQISLVNGMPTLVWADSTVTDDDSVLWSTTSKLYSASYNGGSWGNAQELISVSKPVLQVVAGAQNGNLVAAYVVDEDGLPETTEDQTLYCSGSTTPLDANVQGKVTFNTLPGQTADFIWNAENCLKTASGEEIPAEGITREYAIAGNRIYYSAAGDEGAHLTTVIYESGTWSGSVTLTGGERYLENISVINWNGNAYVMGMDTLATITSNSVTDAKNLVYGQVMPTSNLRLDGLDYDADGLTAGATVPVKVTVTNAGDHTVSSVDISVNNGVAGNYSCTIASGASAEITVNVTCPETLTEYSFTVSENGQSDFAPEDNTASIGIGYSDLAVEVEEERIEDQSSLVVFLTNKGVAPATGTITVSDASGNPVKNTSFTNLVSGDTFVVSYPMQDSGVYTATATLTNIDAELYTYNNSDTTSIGDLLQTTTYVITFDANGGIVSPNTMVTNANGNLTSLPIPTYEGYAFKGWFTAPIGGQQITLGRVFDQDTTVYAQWTQNITPPEPTTFTITFNANGGMVTPITMTTGGDGKLAELPIPVRNGYSFNGWFTALVGGEQVTVNTVFTNDTTVYAQWTYNNSSVGNGDYYYPNNSTPSNDNGSNGTSYSITTPPSVTGGHATVSPQSAKKGDTVTITVTPDSGYELDYITATDKNGNNISLTDRGNGKYVFTMPNGNVTLDYAFKFIKPDFPNPSTINFVDVAPSAYYYDAVAWAVGQGITNGTTATTFSPDAPCTRGQIVTFLWRAAGSPSANGTSPFTDVQPGDYWYDAVLWAVSNGITTGTSVTTFSPNDTCTRGQTVTFLYRNAGSPAVSASATFTDVTSDAYYCDAVAWALSKGITNGTSESTFSPQDQCTRGQIVTFLYRSLAK